MPGAANPQSWNRYAYVSNTPTNFNDPSGHKPCWASKRYSCNISGQDVKKSIKGAKNEEKLFSILKFFGGLFDDDNWRYAANKYLPADHKGSNLTTSVTLGGHGGGVFEVNYVTTASGEFQIFFTHGSGYVSPQIGEAITFGNIDGNFNSTNDFTGYSAQAAISASKIIGLGADGWVGLKENNAGGLSLSGVYGIDGGPTIGWSPKTASGSVVFSNSTPANKVVRNKLTGAGLMSSPFMRAYANYADEVSYNPGFSGFGLFVCRLAFQCGRGSEMVK